jgi:hypothetical protein
MLQKWAIKHAVITILKVLLSLITIIIFLQSSCVDNDMV